DNLAAGAVVHIADVSLGADNHAAAAGGIGALDAVFTENDAAGGEIRPLDKLGQFFDGGVRVINEMGDAFTDLSEVVRRNIRGHTDGDTGTAVDQQVRQAGR